MLADCAALIETGLPHPFVPLERESCYCAVPWSEKQLGEEDCCPRGQGIQLCLTERTARRRQGARSRRWERSGKTVLGTRVRYGCDRAAAVGLSVEGRFS